jgi:hypothetical protein
MLASPVKTLCSELQSSKHAQGIQASCKKTPESRKIKMKMKIREKTE